MNEQEFVRLCKKAVADYANAHLDKADHKQITEADVFVVWQCKTLQNNKADPTKNRCLPSEYGKRCDNMVEYPHRLISMEHCA